MLNCKEATALMSQALDRRLRLGERIGLRLHLWTCSGCANFRRQMEILRQICCRLGGREDDSRPAAPGGSDSRP